ncbi:cupin domain-containing protein [Aporhodopirellula aestuarii]|uniref:Cupin domain-containing protein n=1 Tax=Aporhodopirellula aestuarii TaxID=2950107 RepID=A0ABT0U2T7_9BACT|nr:cupin domain-containing protein [Aporhodopirellula aestuarii]MCM2371192.1 cupin domain-containing protein [Aporhodopirellula aestuarii]
MAEPRIVDLTAIEPVACPCGLARRAFGDFPEFPGTVHLTEIESTARAHSHSDHTEIYVILACGPDAAIELDGVRTPVTPMTAIAIPPGVVHRAIGKMQTLIICHPEFDPRDERLVDC